MKVLCPTNQRWGGDVLFWVRNLSASACVDPGILVRGGPGQSDKKSSDDDFFFFFFFFWSSAYFLRKSNGQFQRNLSFFKVLEGVQHFPGGGSNFFRGGGGGPIAYSL